MKPALGTFVEIGVFEPRSDCAPAIATAFDEIEVIQRLMSFHDPDSELSRLNRNPGKRVPLSTLTLRALRLARGMTAASGSLFNCTVGGALVARGRLPDHGGPAAMRSGDAADLELFMGGARLCRPVRITLDGIAKGFAVDRALAALRRAGLADAWVNAGGDVRVVGRHALPVRLCESPTTVALSNGAIATSATHADHDDSHPGEIVGSGGSIAAIGQWSVLAAQAWRADALTKVAALASMKERAALLARLGGKLIEAPNSLTTRVA